MITVTEERGRIYIRLAGPHRDRLARALMQAFPGHRQLFYSHAHDRFRLWPRDREHLAVWLETYCERSWIDWR